MTTANRRIMYVFIDVGSWARETMTSTSSIPCGPMVPYSDTATGLSSFLRLEAATEAKCLLNLVTSALSADQPGWAASLSCVPGCVSSYVITSA